MSEYLVRPRHLPFDFLQRRPHPSDMRRPASVSVEARKVGDVPLDHIETDKDVLGALHEFVSVKALT